MGGTAGQKGLPGFGTKGAVPGLNATQQFKIPAMQGTPALQAIPTMPALGGPTLGLPNAPRLPQNPYAAAAWRRQTIGPKRSAPEFPKTRANHRMRAQYRAALTCRWHHPTIAPRGGSLFLC
jgi:hypothetical protein